MSLIVTEMSSSFLMNQSKMYVGCDFFLWNGTSVDLPVPIKIGSGEKVKFLLLSINTEI